MSEMTTTGASVPLRPLCVFCGSAATHSQTYTTRRTRVSTVYHRCAVCGGVFLAEACRVPPAVEKARYDEHNNTLADPRNRAYFADFLDALLAALAALGVAPAQTARWRVLDFGSGPAPSLVLLMRERGVFASAVGWDPYYAPAPGAAPQPGVPADAVLPALGADAQYDLVTAQEVVEHFADPLGSWKRLAGAVRAGGFVAVATYLLPRDEGDVYGRFDALPGPVAPCAAPLGVDDAAGEDIAEKRPREVDGDGASAGAATQSGCKRARTGVEACCTGGRGDAQEDEEPVRPRAEMQDGACMPARFADWAYRRDPTHVSFYTLAALRYVADCVGLDYVCSPGNHKFLFRKR